MIGFNIELRRQQSPDLLNVNLRERESSGRVTRSLCVVAQGYALSLSLALPAQAAAPVTI